MRLLAWMLVIGIGVTMGIGKVALEAKRNSLLIETRKLQDRRLKLQEELHALQGEAETLKDTDRLAIHARNSLGLVPIDLANVERLDVAQELIAEVASYLPESDLSAQSAQPESRPALIARVFSYLEQAARASEVERPASRNEKTREIARADSALP